MEIPELSNNCFVPFSLDKVLIADPPYCPYMPWIARAPYEDWQQCAPSITGNQRSVPTHIYL